MNAVPAETHDPQRLHQPKRGVYVHPSVSVTSVTSVTSPGLATGGSNGSNGCNSDPERASVHTLFPDDKDMS